MKQVIKAAAKAVDRGVVSASLAVAKERPALLSFTFHGLFETRDEARDGTIYPHQMVTIDDLHFFIGHFKNAGYRFISPAELLSGLDADGHYALMTFDDGYANNLRALPVLREHNAPATFFVTTNNVARSRCFWWDVHYRERTAQGMGKGAVIEEQEAWKRAPFNEIESRTREAFGDGAFAPRGETDRPMTEDELKAFAADPLVTIGNHTADHAILTMCDAEARDRQLRDSQAYFGRALGSPPDIIAYPNGNFDDAVIAAARAAGLKLGMIVGPRKTRLPLADSEMMMLDRYVIDPIEGGPSLEQQCRACRSDIQILNTVRRVRRLRRAHQGMQ